jgi:hypothetical protein
MCTRTYTSGRRRNACKHIKAGARLVSTESSTDTHTHTHTLKCTRKHTHPHTKAQRHKHTNTKIPSHTCMHTHKHTLRESFRNSCGVAGTNHTTQQQTTVLLLFWFERPRPFAPNARWGRTLFHTAPNCASTLYNRQPRTKRTGRQHEATSAEIEHQTHERE